MSRNDGGPAYPQIETVAAYDANIDLYSDTYSSGGMTMRQYYKAAALQGLLASGTVQWNEALTIAAQAADRAIAEDRAHEEKGEEKGDE